MSRLSVVLSAAVALAPSLAAADDGADVAETNGVGVGLAVGQSTRAVGSFAPAALPIRVDAGVGTGVFEGTGLQITADVSWERALPYELDLGLGAGVRYFRHHYRPSSVDETGFDRHLGVRLVATVSRRLSLIPIDLFAEVAPGVDVSRTTSCTFMSGVDTVCAHDRETPLFVDLAVGARWWFDL